MRGDSTATSARVGKIRSAATSVLPTRIMSKPQPHPARTAEQPQSLPQGCQCEVGVAASVPGSKDGAEATLNRSAPGSATARPLSRAAKPFPVSICPCQSPLAQFGAIGRSELFLASDQRGGNGRIEALTRGAGAKCSGGRRASLEMATRAQIPPKAGALGSGLRAPRTENIVPSGTKSDGDGHVWDSLLNSHLYFNLLFCSPPALTSLRAYNALHIHPAPALNLGSTLTPPELKNPGPGPAQNSSLISLGKLQRVRQLDNLIKLDLNLSTSNITWTGRLTLSWSFRFSRTGMTTNPAPPSNLTPPAPERPCPVDSGGAPRLPCSHQTD